MFNTEAIKSIIAGLIRFALMWAFGWAVKGGYVTTESLETAIPILLGGVLVIASMVWRKIKTRFQIEAASILPADSTISEIKSVANENLAELSSVTKILP
jgi:hypothetical protein